MLLVLTLVLIVLAIGSGFAAFRPRHGSEPDQRGITPFWTETFAWFAALALACIPGWIACEIIRAAVTNISNPDKAAHWSDILSPIGFVGGLVPATIFLLNEVFTVRDLDTSWAGVLAPFGRRWRKRYLSEGTHRILWFVKVIPVDMAKRIVPAGPFLETSGDKNTMSGDGNFEFRVYDPDEFLDVREAAALAGLKQRYLKKARDYIRAHKDDELTAPPARDTMSEEVRKELVSFATQFINPNQTNPANADDKLVVNITRLDPPDAETQAAAKKKAAEQDNLRKQIEINGFNSRFESLKTANPTLPVEKLQELFERYEGLRDTDQIIIDGLGGDGSQDSTGVRALAASMLNRSTEQGRRDNPDNRRK